MNDYGKEIARVSRCSRRLMAVSRKLKTARMEEQPALVRRADRLLARAYDLMAAYDA